MNTKMRVAAGHLTYVESADPLPHFSAKANEHEWNCVKHLELSLRTE